MYALLIYCFKSVGYEFVVGLIVLVTHMRYYCVNSLGGIMNQIISDAVYFIEREFFLNVSVKDDFSDELPFQLKNKAQAYTVLIEGNPFLFIAIQNDEVLSVNSHILFKRLSVRFSYPIILVARNIKYKTRKEFGDSLAGYIVPGEFLSIPSMFIKKSAKPYEIENTYVDNEKIFGVIPSYIISYYLSNYFDDWFNSFDVMKVFDVSKMAVSRALRELIGAGIIIHDGKDRYKSYRFAIGKSDIWHNYRYRITPLSTGFISVPKSSLHGRNFFFSGETALSNFSELSAPGTQQLGIYLSSNERYLRTISPATIEGETLFKAIGLLNDGKHNINYENYYSDEEALVQIFPYEPIFVNDCLNEVFLALSRFNKLDVRVRASYQELERTISLNLSHN